MTLRLPRAIPKYQTLRLFTVGTKSQEGIKFSAPRIVYRQGREDAKRLFAKYEKGQALEITPERISPHQAGEMRAVDLILKSASNIVYERIVLLEKDLLQMIVESPSSYDASVQQFATVFFDSLVVDTK